MTGFIVYSLPRSRSRWLAELLTFGEWKCWHDVSAGMRDMDDVARFFARPNTGTIETAAAPGWMLLAYRFPELRTVVLERAVPDVIASMALAFERIPHDAELLGRIVVYEARLLRDISKRPGVLTVMSADLGKRDVARAVFEHCLPHAMPDGHFDGLRDRNIQVNMQSVIAYRLAHRPEIEAFKRAAKADLRALVRGGKLSKRLAQGIAA